MSGYPATLVEYLEEEFNCSSGPLGSNKTSTFLLPFVIVIVCLLDPPALKSAVAFLVSVDLCSQSHISLVAVILSFNYIIA